MANKLCTKCGRMRDEDREFYSYKDRTKTDMCRDCLTMHMNIFEPDTFLWVLEKLDVPYVPAEWNILRDRDFNKNPNGKASATLGKYLSKMKLKQWIKYGWADSESLKAQYEEKVKIEEAEREQYEKDLKIQLDQGKITSAQYKSLVSTETLNKEHTAEVFNKAAENQSSPYMKESELEDFSSQLTDEDKIFLAMKWGRLYKPNEWLALEKTYNEMTESFDIQDADTINTLILICKTNLKMNQFLDSGDIEGFQKVSKVSESLRKTAKFTAAQNKEQSNDYLDSIGDLVAYCEKNGGAIPRYEIDTPMDIVDKVIADLKNYTKELVYDDKSLAKQIEDYLKKVEIARQQKEDRKKAEEKGLDYVEIDDKDYEEYYNSLEENKKLDEVIENGGEE